MLGLLLLQVLASCLWLGHSEVVQSFARCSQFFYAGTIPSDVLNPQKPAWICQYYNNSHHYATLYNKDKRIPVYSAYKYEPGPEKRPPSWWMVEPQLIGKNNLKEMKGQKVLIEQHNFTLAEIKASQAVLSDYDKTGGYDRGHLNPSGHHNSANSRAATFTLTNIVPQEGSLNNGQWEYYESRTMSKKAKGCKTTYVITGAVPGNTYIANGRVNVPSHIWSAACCLGSTEPKDAWGVIAENNKNKVENLKLGELEDKLSKLYGGRAVTLFNNACPRK